MSKLITVVTNVNIGGNVTTISKSFNCDAADENAPNETAPAAKVGALTTRTSDTAGVFTKLTHGVLDTETIAIFWTGGARYDVDIDSVTGDTITFSGGNGDNLPADESAVSVSQMLQLDVPVNGTNLQALCLQADQDFIASVVDASGDSVLMAERDANDAFLWYDGNGDNPVTGHTDIVAVNFYNKSATAASVKALHGKNNTLSQV